MRSTKKNFTIRKVKYDFLFALALSYIISGDKAIYWSKIAIFSYPAFDVPVRWSPSECCHSDGYPMVEKV